MNPDRPERVPTELKLYGYWRSSATWRVRWALELKKIPFTYIPVNLVNGENKSPEHLKRNALGAVPVLEITPGVFLSESMALLEWIEEVYPNKKTSLFAGTPVERARIRQLCEVINADTAPLQTPRVQKRHSSDVGEQKLWAQDFITQGLKLFDALSRQTRGLYSAGDFVSAADLCLIPQMYNGLRWGLDVKSGFQELWKVYERARATEECVKASPETQIDSAQS